jgi:transcriptional regulator with XRE-family HTH domain
MPRTPNDALRRQRQLRGWSQQRLAEQLGTDENTVSRWERGERQVAPFYQEKLCLLFETTADQLGLILHNAYPQAEPPEQVADGHGGKIIPFPLGRKPRIYTFARPCSASSEATSVQ